jgi:hypothetical protein
VPKFSGTQGSLIRNRPKLEDLVFADDNGLLDEQKLKIISQLVKDKHMAWRGWWKLEVFIFGLILAMLTITEFLFHNYHFTGLAEFILAESCNVGIFIGLLIVAYEIIGLDKEPNEYYINEAKEKIKFDDIRSSMNCINIRKRK